MLWTRPLILYHRRLDYVGSPYAISPTSLTAATQVNLMQLNLTDPLPGFDVPVGLYYLWRPDLP